MRTTSASESTDVHDHRRTARALAALAVGIALTAGLVGCGSGTEDAQPKASATVAARATEAAGEPSSTEGVVPADETATPGSAGGGPADSSSPTGGNGQPSAPAPVIDSFATPDDIDCHNGDFQQFTVSWTTSHATRVEIAIDGPGAYDTYGPDGEAGLPFNCSSSHTFALTAFGEGGTATRRVTLQPRNVRSSPSEVQVAARHIRGGMKTLPAGALATIVAKVSGGATGTGPADQRDCDALATHIDSLFDIAVEALEPGGGGFDAAMAALDEVDRVEDKGLSLGCFFVYT